LSHFTTHESASVILLRRMRRQRSRVAARDTRHLSRIGWPAIECNLQTGVCFRELGLGGEEGMGFQLHTREIGRVVVVEAVGRLTLTDGHTKLRDLMHVSIGDDAKKFVLNLMHVEFIDSYGIGELARCYSIVRQAGGDLKLASLTQRVLDVLAISRLNTLFEIHATEGAAIRAFGQQA
jgi:anti-sigma B factor antagonist